MPPCAQYIISLSCLWDFLPIDQIDEFFFSAKEVIEHLQLDNLHLNCYSGESAEI